MSKNIETTQKVIKRNTKKVLKALAKKISSSNVEFSFAKNSGYVDLSLLLTKISGVLQEEDLFEVEENDVGDEKFIDFYQNYVVKVAKLYDLKYAPLKDLTPNGKKIFYFKNGKTAFVHVESNKYRYRESNEAKIEEKLGFFYVDGEEVGLMDEEDDMIAQGKDEIEAVVKKNWRDVLECDYKAKESAFSRITTEDFKGFSHVDNSPSGTKNSVNLKKFERDNKINEEVQRILYSLRIVSNKGMNFKDDENGQVLKENFIKFYGIKHYPKYAEAHHIAPKKNNFEAANDCRQIVINYLVDINHPCNCVPLPKDERRADILGTAQHNGPCVELHGKEIMDCLFGDLYGKNTASDVIEILSDYRLKMLGITE